MRRTSTNTRLTYRYWRGDGWDREVSVVAAGRLSNSQRGRLLASLDGNLFLPSQVGLAALLPQPPRHDDVPWHEMIEVADTYEPADPGFFAEELAATFAEVEWWDAAGAKEALGIPSQSREMDLLDDVVMWTVFAEDD